MATWKALALFLSVTGVFTISSAAVTPSFDSLLDSLPDDSLQEALGGGSPGSDHKFDGGERAALQALHDADPDAADKVLSMVQLELAKRQLPSIGISAGVSVPDVVPSLPVSVSVPSVALPTSEAQTSSVPLPSSTPAPTSSPLPSSFPPRESFGSQAPTSRPPAPTSSLPAPSSTPAPVSSPPPTSSEPPPASRTSAAPIPPSSGTTSPSDVVPAPVPLPSAAQPSVATTSPVQSSAPQIISMPRSNPGGGYGSSVNGGPGGYPASQPQTTSEPAVGVPSPGTTSASSASPMRSSIAGDLSSVGTSGGDSTTRGSRSSFDQQPPLPITSDVPGYSSDSVPVVVTSAGSMFFAPSSSSTSNMFPNTGSIILRSSSDSGPAPGSSVIASSAGSAIASSVPQSSSNVPSSVEPTSEPQTSAAATSGNGGIGGGNGGVSPSGPPVIVPVPQTSIAGGQTTVNTGFATFRPTRSTVIEGTDVPVIGVTTTNSQGQAITTDQPLGIPPGSGPGTGGNGGGNDVTTTDQYGNTVVLPNASDGAVITATDVNGRVITTTYHPGGTRAVKSTLVLSSTLSGGQNTLVTLTAFVVPNAVTGAAGVEDGGTRTRAAAGLQTGNAADTTRRVGAEAFALAIGVAGVAFAL